MKRYKSTICLALYFFCVVTSASSLAEQRIALIVTNQNYPTSVGRLANTHNNGQTVAKALERVGFVVRVVRDADKSVFVTAISNHVRLLEEAGSDGVGLFYYAGHGAAQKKYGDNFLVPVGASITSISELPRLAIKLGDIIDSISAINTRANFIVVDASRNLPLKRSVKSVFKGFSVERERGGVLIAYATEPGTIALKDNFYAQVLASEIEKPDQPAVLMFRSVRRRVLQATDNRQFPWTRDGLVEEFYFGGRTGESNLSQTGQKRRIELAYWDTIRNSDRIAEFKSYLKKYPDGMFKKIAKLRIQGLANNKKRLSIKNFDGYWEVDLLPSKCRFGIAGVVLEIKGGQIINVHGLPDGIRQGSVTKFGNLRFIGKNGRIFLGQISGKSGAGGFRGTECVGRITFLSN